MQVKTNTWNKLVRDGIPQIIEENGGAAEIRILEDEEYKQLLKEKLVEEAKEVVGADQDNLIEELADVRTVIDAILEVNNLDWQNVLDKQIEKDKKRGKFQKRIYLISTKEK